MERCPTNGTSDGADVVLVAFANRGRHGAARTLWHQRGVGLVPLGIVPLGIGSSRDASSATLVQRSTRGWTWKGAPRCSQRRSLRPAALHAAIAAGLVPTIAFAVASSVATSKPRAIAAGNADHTEKGFASRNNPHQ